MNDGSTMDPYLRVGVTPVEIELPSFFNLGCLMDTARDRTILRSRFALLVRRSG